MSRAQLAEQVKRLLPGEENKRIRQAIMLAYGGAAGVARGVKNEIDQENRLQNGILINGQIDITSPTSATLTDWAWVIDFAIQQSGSQTIPILAPDEDFVRLDFFHGDALGAIHYTAGELDAAGNAIFPNIPEAHVILVRVARNPDGTNTQEPIPGEQWEDAPFNGKTYARRNKEWVALFELVNLLFLHQDATWPLYRSLKEQLLDYIKDAIEDGATYIDTDILNNYYNILTESKGIVVDSIEVDGGVVKDISLRFLRREDIPPLFISDIVNLQNILNTIAGAGKGLSVDLDGNIQIGDENGFVKIPFLEFLSEGYLGPTPTETETFTIFMSKDSGSGARLFIGKDYNTGNTQLLKFNEDGTITLNDDHLLTGIKNAGDYEQNFTARSLVTKQFVESYVPQTDGIVIKGTITQLIDDLTLNDAWRWRISNVTYNPTGNTTLNFPPAATGFQRIDLIVGDNLGIISKVTGTEIAIGDPITAPTPPANTIPLAEVSVIETGISSFVEFALSSFIRYDINNQGLSAVQRLNARTNIQALARDVSDLKYGNISFRDANNAQNILISQGSQGSETLGFIHMYNQAGTRMFRLLGGTPQTGLGSQSPTFYLRTGGAGSTRTLVTWDDNVGNNLFSMLNSGVHVLNGAGTFNGIGTRNGFYTNNGNIVLNGTQATLADQANFRLRSGRLNADSNHVILRISNGDGVTTENELILMNNRGGIDFNVTTGSPGWRFSSNGVLRLQIDAAGNIDSTVRSDSATTLVRRDELPFNYPETVVTTGIINDLALANEGVKLLILTLADELTGVVPVTTTLGRELKIEGRTAGGVIIRHESASSIAANRFALPGAVDLTIAENEIYTFIYTNGRWRRAL